ncbi:hypothetical protein PPL_03880 [Heterostelium album PN500]|uniref:Transmembrane protein n=1 Tax=Heterostelium pallidum (strain ATCC 26659 / Pp 5 / PN500) TaxID=670386 RepID=D3B5E2_HETP5|nr:hypothetical protein PPL_03880 [Heterostelium album PN500]EFA83090.1 hypothetical protein PPL_03880 [Heterostelium album PN500]|eukprot:XP_020435207.1 hypothetical protein PPL_03880 [Heterostelium album PN500]
MSKVVNRQIDHHYHQQHQHPTSSIYENNRNMENENNNRFGDLGGIPNYIPVDAVHENNNVQQEEEQQQQQHHFRHRFGLRRGVMPNPLAVTKTSPFVSLIVILVIFWLLVFLFDVPYDIDVYRHYVIGTCFFHHFYHLDWFQYDESSYSFQATAEVLVNTNKNTKKELKELYPSFVITSTTDYESNKLQEQQQQKQQNIQYNNLDINNNNLENNNNNNFKQYLYLPFKTNISIDQNIGELTYNARKPPYEVSRGSPYSHPHRCFFHPVTKDVTTTRSVLPLFCVALLGLVTVASSFLVLSHSLRQRFNQIPLIFIIYIVLQIISLAFLDTVDYTFYDLAHQIVTRIIVFGIADLAYEFLTNSQQERATFHIFVFVLYIAGYYHIIV